MSKRIYTLLIGIFIIASTTSAQISISFEDSNVDPGNTVEVDVSVANFTDIIGLQFGIPYDSLVLRYNSIININTDLTTLNEGLISTPGPLDSDLEEGNISMAWNWDFMPTTPTTIPDGVLFTIVFEAVGSACDSALITLYDGNDNEPLNLEASNLDFEVVPVAFNESTVLINGPDCSGTGGGEDDVTFILENVNMPVGTDTCVKMTVENFDNIIGFQLPVTWDHTIIEYTGIVVPTGSVEGILESYIDTIPGDLNLIWTDPLAEEKSLADGTVLVELCFHAVGSVGESTDLTIVDELDGFELLVFSNDDDDLPVATVDGKVTLTDGPVNVFTIIASNEEISDNEVACVNYTALNFIGISSLELHFDWDQSILQYKEVQMTNIPGLAPDLFSYNSTTELLTLTWTTSNANGLDYPDNTTMFKICFDEVVDCSASSSAVVSDVVIVDHEVTMEVPNEDPIIIDVELEGGSVKVACGILECMLVDLDHPDCAGDEGGNITVNLLDAPVGCSCVWTKDGEEVSSLSTPNCNLLGVGAGTYTLEVICGSEAYCSGTWTLLDPSEITVTETITPIGCTSTGMISLAVSGGSSPYEYEWNPTLSGDDKVNITTAGQYCVTVTDANDCTFNMCYDVDANTTSLDVTFEVENVSCNGANDGSLKAVGNGGCPQYTFQWGANGGNSTDSTIPNLAPNTYLVTITDANGLEAIGNMTITEPEVLTALYDTVPVSATMGSISLTPEGGTEPYTYLWDDGETTRDRIGVALGFYDVTIKDANDCEFEIIDIEVVGVDVNDFTIIADAGSDYNGFEIQCFGECSGIVDYSVLNGTLPIAVTLKNGTNTESITITVYGNYSFEEVCAGNGVSVTGVDATGATASSVIFNMSAPTQLGINAEIVHPDPDMDNGSITLTVTGGVPNYTYKWDHNEMVGPIQLDLGKGEYNVIVTDANSCPVMAHYVLGKDDPKCYKAPGAITPNGDGVNDQFVISCAMKFDNTLSIYSRYGEEVFSATNYDNTWEGGDLIEGGYMYVLRVNFDNGENKTYKGTFAIIR